MGSILIKDDINALFNTMGEELAANGSEFTFIQLRMSAEHFVVPLCGLSTERAVSTSKPNQYHVYFEKRLSQFKQGPVDLVLVPTSKDGTEDWNTAYCFEFKMVWLNGIKGNVLGIKKDIEKLNGYDRGYVVAILFSFAGGPDWAPYKHTGDMEQLVKAVVSEIGTPMYKGQEYRIANHEMEGKLRLLAWATDTRGTYPG